ncbi:MAG: GNAT family N-acetyltransferase, partial [Promethearchaeota archaeon]
MTATNETERRRILTKLVGFSDLNKAVIELSADAANILDLDKGNLSSNFGPLKLTVNQALLTINSMRASSQLAQKLGIQRGDYLEIIQISKTVHLKPIKDEELKNYYFSIDGADKPRVILLSSHAEFEPYTREIATLIHQTLQEESIPSLRIELKKQFIESNRIFDVTISRYEVDITRNRDTPETIAKKLVNKNRSYRILADLYFDFLTRFLPIDHPCIVVDIHGIATVSPKGILHPKIIVGDALLRNPLVEKFTRTLRKVSKDLISDPWFVYSPKWGAVEYSLHLVKITKNIPMIIEIRRDLRDNPESRQHLVTMISQALVALVNELPAWKDDIQSVVFRTFTNKDLKQVFFVYMEAFSDLYRTQVREYGERFIQLFKSAVQAGVEGEMFIAEEMRRIVGFAAIHEESPHNWKLGPIAVHSSKQRLGIGASLLELCLNYARSKNTTEIHLKVHEHNNTAIRFYLNHNFQIIGSSPSDIPGILFLHMVHR